MGVIGKVLILIALFLLGIAILVYGQKLQQFYVNMYVNDEKKPVFWEFSSSKEHTDKEIIRGGWFLIICSVISLIIFILDYFIT